MTNCPLCDAPIVQRVTTGEYWCAVYGRHGGPRLDVPPEPPLPASSVLMRWDGAQWRTSGV